jgi:hypothetical protein
MKINYEKTIIFSITLLILGLLSQSCSINKANGENMNFNMIQTVLKELIDQNKAVIIKDAPFIYDKDLFEGTKKKLNENLWVMGEWILKGTYDNLTATVQKRFGYAGSEWEAEVLDVSLTLHKDKYVIDNWKAYKIFGEGDREK